MKKTIDSPWDFSCPPYDQRSSNYINAGRHFGVGKRQPVGSAEYSAKGGVPFGRGKQMETDQAPRYNLKVNLQE